MPSCIVLCMWTRACSSSRRQRQTCPVMLFGAGRERERCLVSRWVRSLGAQFFSTEWHNDTRWSHRKLTRVSLSVRAARRGRRHLYRTASRVGQIHAKPLAKLRVLCKGVDQPDLLGFFTWKDWTVDMPPRQILESPLDFGMFCGWNTLRAI